MPALVTVVCDFSRANERVKLHAWAMKELPELISKPHLTKQSSAKIVNASTATQPTEAKVLRFT